MHMQKKLEKCSYIYLQITISPPNDNIFPLTKPKGNKMCKRLQYKTTAFQITTKIWEIITLNEFYRFLSYFLSDYRPWEIISIENNEKFIDISTISQILEM